MTTENLILRIIDLPGDDLASTWVAKPEVHVENVENLVKSSANI